LTRPINIGLSLWGQPLLKAHARPILVQSITLDDRGKSSVMLIRFGMDLARGQNDNGYHYQKANDNGSHYQKREKT